MPIYDVTWPKHTEVDADSLETSALLTTARRLLASSTFDKVNRTIDRGLDSTKTRADKKNQLIFTKAGIILGNRSPEPYADVDHFWISIQKVFKSRKANGLIDETAEENQHKLFGTWVRWRISLRDETWLMDRQPTGKLNRRGEEIHVSRYWVDESYVFRPPLKKKRVTLADLQLKFSGGR